ncbi:hypothetical protein D3C75_921010 [compost metagenome]
MQLIADRAPCAIGNTECSFITERIRVLIAAEFSPGCMEFPGHAEKLDAQRLRISGRQREMIITPTARRQRLQLQMAVHPGKVAPAARDVSAIMEDRQSRLDRFGRFLHPGRIIGVGSLP